LRGRLDVRRRLHGFFRLPGRGEGSACVTPIVVVIPSVARDRPATADLLSIRISRR
jgi:hypothetical protein